MGADHFSKAGATAGATAVVNRAHTAGSHPVRDNEGRCSNFLQVTRMDLVVLRHGQVSGPAVSYVQQWADQSFCPKWLKIVGKDSDLKSLLITLVTIEIATRTVLSLFATSGRSA